MEPQSPPYDENVEASEPLILAIDTTAEHGSLALARGETLLECEEVQAHQAFSRVIFDHIGALLRRHGFALGDVDLYAAAAGPGSFTGVRVGLTAAKGLAEVHGKRVAPVSNLAATALLAPPGPRILIPVLDARRNELYAAVYERTSGPLEPLMPKLEEIVARPEGLRARLEQLELPAGEAAYCGPDVEKFELALFRRLVTSRALAGAVAALAWAAYQRGATVLPESAEANYVRRSDAEIFHPAAARDLPDPKP